MVELLLPTIREKLSMCYASFKLLIRSLYLRPSHAWRVGRLWVTDNESGTVDFLRAERGGGLSKFREGQYSMGQEG